MNPRWRKRQLFSWAGWGRVMRSILLAGMLGATMLIATMAAGQNGDGTLAKRFGFDANEIRYSQKTPEDALKSVVAAIESKKIDYLVAQLADPSFVDGRIKEYMKSQTGSDEARAQRAFTRLVQETRDHFLEDPLLVKELKLFAKDGTWKSEDKTAAATVKNLPDRQVFMRKLDNRWFLENKQK